MAAGLRREYVVDRLPMLKFGNSPSPIRTGENVSLRKSASTNNAADGDGRQAGAGTRPSADRRRQNIDHVEAIA